LAKALYTSIGIPLTLCCLIYTFLYCTYPRDRDRARLESQLELEMQQIRMDTLDSPDYLSIQTRDQNDDDDDEKRLLGREIGDTEHVLLNEVQLINGRNSEL